MVPSKQRSNRTYIFSVSILLRTEREFRESRETVDRDLRLQNDGRKFDHATDNNQCNFEFLRFSMCHSWCVDWNFRDCKLRLSVLCLMGL